jgi:hypothetical protein
MRTTTQTWSPSVRAALLRDRDGVVVGTTWGDTACWNPRRPGSFRAVDEADGREHIIRCRDCPGCREYEAYELERRLVAHYAEVRDELWCIIVHCPLELQAQLSASLHRRRHLTIEPGFYRLGTQSIAFIARGAKPIVPRDVQERWESQVVRIKRSRGRRAWTIVTAGMRHHRADYGEWTNRFYHRGLARRDRGTRWAFSSRGGIVRRHNLMHDAVAWRDGVSVHRPQVCAIVWSRKRGSYVQWFGTEAAGASAILDRLMEGLRDSAVPPSPLMSSFARAAAARAYPAAGARRVSEPTRIGAVLGGDQKSTELTGSRHRLSSNRWRYAGSLHLEGGPELLRAWLERRRAGPGSG